MKLGGASVAAAFALCNVVLLTALILAIRLYAVYSRRRYEKVHAKRRVFCFFHPHCSAGGGGERVLWMIVKVLSQDKSSDIKVVILTVDAYTKTYKQDVIKHAHDRFSIDIPDTLDLSFVHLEKHRHLLSPAKFLSMFVESIGTMILAYHGLLVQPCHVFFDTTGCAFTYIVARILFAVPHVVAYTHYPTISTDMLQLVWEQRRAAYSDIKSVYSSAGVASATTASKDMTTGTKSNDTTRSLVSRCKMYIKLVYYIIFAVAYGIAGSMATLVMVNSTWTYDHIRSLWRYASWKNRIQILYPPCMVNDTYNDDTSRRREDATILSIGQFRPEKDHVLQIQSVQELIRTYPMWKSRVKLVLLGSCRGSADEERLRQLQSLVRKLNLESNVEFVVNEPYSVVISWLEKASVGIHTMWNEHFGIGIVEMMSAGLIVVAHNSGGPRSDIVVSTNGEPSLAVGLLASTSTEYAQMLHQALTLPTAQSRDMRRRAHDQASHFSDQVFKDRCTKILQESKLLLDLDR